MIVVAFLIFPYRFVAFGRAAIEVIGGNRLFLTISETCVERRNINGASFKIDQCDGTIEPYRGHD